MSPEDRTAEALGAMACCKLAATVMGERDGWEGANP